MLVAWVVSLSFRRVNQFNLLNLPKPNERSQGILILVRRNDAAHKELMLEMAAFAEVKEWMLENSAREWRGVDEVAELVAKLLNLNLTL